MGDMEIAKFLLARIAEDEEVARPALGARIDLSDGIWTDAAAARQMRRWDPARVLAECEAKRRIVGEARDYSPELSSGDNGEWAFDLTLRLLALPYADHPEYREEWGLAKV